MIADVSKVTAVLLSDGWHTVLNHSFTVDNLTLQIGNTSVERDKHNNLPGFAAAWQESVNSVTVVTVCPFSSILAVRR